jgi:hypothetical protein
MSVMRYLAAAVVAVLLNAAPAAAAVPRFALWDLQSDLAQQSRNEYGDVAVKPARALAHVRGATVVRCGTWCRFGSGYLAFSKPAHLTAGDVAGASVRYTKKLGWTVRLSLHPAARARWSRFSHNVLAQAKLHGVPDVLVVVAGGQIAAAPLATQVQTAQSAVTLTGFSRASARQVAKSLG